MDKKTIQLFLSCEHGGNIIPSEYAHLFKEVLDIVETHRGYDKGALPLFDVFKKQLQPSFAIYSEICRLVVDLNRSLHRRTLFSEWTKPLDSDVKQRILSNYYFNYRESFIEALRSCINGGNRCLHLSVHSFTPVLNGIERTTDIGILYHPGRPWEKEIAAKWKESLVKHLPQLRVRFNYPYLGKPDGHVAYHRKVYDNDQYAGIELELNLKHASNQDIYSKIVKAFDEVLLSYARLGKDENHGFV